MCFSSSDVKQILTKDRRFTTAVRKYGLEELTDIVAVDVAGAGFDFCPEDFHVSTKREAVLQATLSVLEAES